jgi:hypothetical protein
VHNQAGKDTQVAKHKDKNEDDPLARSPEQDVPPAPPDPPPTALITKAVNESDEEFAEDVADAHDGQDPKVRNLVDHRKDRRPDEPTV